MRLQQRNSPRGIGNSSNLSLAYDQAKRSFYPAAGLLGWESTIPDEVLLTISVCAFAAITVLFLLDYFDP